MRYLFFLIVVSFVSCNSDESKMKISNANNVDSTTNKVISAPLMKTDSLQVLYFDDPDGDSLRYTRFYKFVDSKDSGLINTLLVDLNQPFEKRNDVKDCRSEGKIFLYDDEQPLKTVYFSNRCDSCCYLYYIQDGAFLYFPISSATSASLSQSKLQSRTP